MCWDRTSEKMLLLDLISGAERAGRTGSAPKHKGSTSGHRKGNGRIKRAGWKIKAPGQERDRGRAASFLNACSEPAFQRGWALSVIGDYMHLWLSWTELVFCKYRFVQQESRWSTARCRSHSSLQSYCIGAGSGRAAEAVGPMLRTKAWIKLFLKARGVCQAALAMLERIDSPISISCALLWGQEWESWEQMVLLPHSTSKQLGKCMANPGQLQHKALVSQPGIPLASRAGCPCWNWPAMLEVAARTLPAQAQAWQRTTLVLSRGFRLCYSRWN